MKFNVDEIIILPELQHWVNFHFIASGSYNPTTLNPRGEKMFDARGLHSTEVAYLHLPHQPQVRIPVFPKDFQGKNYWCCWVNQRLWLEENGQWLENVDQTHLVLARGKPVLQKKTCCPRCRWRRWRRSWPSPSRPRPSPRWPDWPRSFVGSRKLGSPSRYLASNFGGRWLGW